MALGNECFTSCPAHHNKTGWFLDRPNPESIYLGSSIELQADTVFRTGSLIVPMALVAPEVLIAHS